MSLVKKVLSSIFDVFLILRLLVMFFKLIIILKNLIEIILKNYNLNCIYISYIFSYEDFLTKLINIVKKCDRLSVYLNIYFIFCTLSIVNKKSICSFK